MRTVNATAASVLPSLYTDTEDRDMSKLRGNAPAGEEVWTARGELRNPADRSDQPGQWAPERTEEAATAASVDKTDHHARTPAQSATRKPGAGRRQFAQKDDMSGGGYELEAVHR
ncbi:hypothetical protein RDV84_12835 [Lysobacter yananisis]|uniref:Uncharacterized protein n=1 Tax=Lysobacter yananisis TaxID=1003114 RepID=A0ABY9PG15_9GAMM|nr:hypothetical protein [Lysobacter yananisis]WMT05685.1 hypothetical protein RDV84_12835 [Lysobacter yananisis]